LCRRFNSVPSHHFHKHLQIPDHLGFFRWTRFGLALKFESLAVLGFFQLRALQLHFTPPAPSRLCLAETALPGCGGVGVVSVRVWCPLQCHCYRSVRTNGTCGAHHPLSLLSFLRPAPPLPAPPSPLPAQRLWGPPPAALSSRRARCPLQGQCRGNGLSGARCRLALFECFAFGSAGFEQVPTGEQRFFP
jgi:hypothetical protein